MEEEFRKRGRKEVKEESLLFGKIVLNNRLATEEQIRHCLELQNEYKQQGQQRSIGEIFVGEGFLTAEQSQKVLEAQKLSLQLRDDSLFGKLAIKNGLVSQGQVEECINHQKNIRYTKRIGEILLEKGYLNEKQYRALLNAQQRVVKLRESRENPTGFTDIVKKPEVLAKVSSLNPSASPSPVPLKKEAPSPPPASQADLSYEEEFVQQAMGMNLITTGQVEECRTIQTKMSEMGIDKSLDQILIDKKYIDSEGLKSLLSKLPIKSPIESYICDEMLGEGAMGTVYKARLKGSNQVVALKVLKPDYSEDREYLRRFIREAQASIELDHPHIVRAYEVGVSGDYYYYSMEYVQGYTVRELLDEQPLPEAKTIEYAIQIASALDYAAEHHLVHRDIKPENIMIDMNSGTAKLCDLGIAKRLDQDFSLTQPGMAVGTPYYISPEQARGNTVDTRSDIYSLGATLYHMVMGEVPFDGDSATQILLQHVTAEVPMACQKKADVSQRFSEIMAKMMAKAPESRYQTPGELSSDLSSFQQGGQSSEKDEQDFEGSETHRGEGIDSPIESYDVHRVLGQGAMGIVYEANQVGSPVRVALKVLLPHVAQDKEFLRRFILEAQATMEFDHPNIVKAYDVGVSGDYFYYSMEWVEGTSVKSVMEDHGGLLPVELALDIAHQIGEALCYAYEKTVVHRDIKPENIMFTTEGIAKLCDLGIAKQLSNDKGLTQPGMAVGSPYYIAPEQARGQKVDCRTDLYSLGATLFHMVTGTVPFEGYTAAAVMAKHVREAVPNPLDRKADLPYDVAAMIVKMMQKKPEDRFDTPMDFVEDVERIQGIL